MSRILIVDDEPEIVRGLEDNLRFEGYQTSTAGDGREALALAARVAPDLILLDIMMPKLDGIAVTKRLKADTARLATTLRTHAPGWSYPATQCQFRCAARKASWAMSSADHRLPESE